MTLSRSVKWIIAVVIALLVYWGIDVPTDLADPKTPLFLAITVGTVVVWAFELMPAAAAGVGMLILYALFVVPPKVAFATFNTFLPWITFSSLIIADAMLNSGLGKRIALRSMLLLGSSYSKTMIGLMLSGFVVVLLVPALLARVVIYMAIAQGLVAALDVDPKSRTSSSLIFGGFLAAVAPSLFILTGSEINLMGMYSTWDVTGEPKPWTDFLVQMGPLNVLYMAFSTFMIFMIRGKDPLPGENNLENILRVRLAEMGNIKPSEIKVLVLLVVGLLAFIFEKQIGYPGTMVYSLIMLLAFLPGVDLCDGKSFSKLNLSFVFFLASCQAIGMVAGALHVDKWLSDLMLPLLQGQGNTMAVLITYLFNSANIGVERLLVELVKGLRQPALLRVCRQQILTRQRRQQGSGIIEGPLCRPAHARLHFLDKDRQHKPRGDRDDKKIAQQQAHADAHQPRPRL